MKGKKRYREGQAREGVSSVSPVRSVSWKNKEKMERKKRYKERQA